MSSSTTPTVLSVDIGTSSVKAGLIDGQSRLIEWGKESIRFTAETKQGIYEVDDLPVQWEEAVSSLVGRMSRIRSISAVSVSGNGPTIVPVASDGKLLTPVLLWIDERAHRIPGEHSFFLPKVAWIMRNKPEVYENAWKFFSCPEYLAYRLTGEAATASPSDAFDPYFWDDASSRHYGVDFDKLPPCVRLTDKIGDVTKKASEQFGLPMGTPVFVGGPDFFMALLGTATVEPGRTCDRAGTSEGINHCAESAVSSSKLRTLPHVIPGKYNVAGILSSTGRIFEWFKHISGQQQISYDKMLQAIVALPHGGKRPLFLPSLYVGATYEFTDAVFMNLEPDHDAADLGRAIVESIGFSIRNLVETLESESCPIDELCASGGQARNHEWNQMKANITGRCIRIPEIIDAELTGDAVVAMTGFGMFDNLVEGAESLFRVERDFEPDDAEHAAFADEYERFLEVRDRVMGIAADYRNTPSRNE